MPAIRRVLFAALLCGLCNIAAADFGEATIAELQRDMESGETSAEEIVRWHLDRIETVDATLNSIIEVNPEALETARRLDEERRESGPRGPLHGIPVVLKANIDTGDKMHTSAGSLALADHIPPDDAIVVQRLREAGAVILAKANLSEWANFRSEYSSSGWSSVGGQTTNAYNTDRNPCGSSSGSAVAVAANLTVLAVGTETNGSVVCPSGINGIVGVKPTLGLVSQDGIIPIAHSQDTAGPMARTVEDAAIMLDAMAGKDVFAANLSANALQGKRIGVVRSFYGAGSYPSVELALEQTIEALQGAGAEIVDDIEIETEGMGDAQYTVLLYEFKTDLNAYLAESGAGMASLEEIIAFNTANSGETMPIFGQDILELAQSKGSLDDDDYLEALATSKRIARDGINGALTEHDLDALIAPTNAPAWLTDHINGDGFGAGSSSLAAISGYPNITVPAAFHKGLPIGISFFGAENHDRQLIEIAYAFEQATTIRRAPGH